jgi:hypothetical protein
MFSFAFIAIVSFYGKPAQKGFEKKASAYPVAHARLTFWAHRSFFG